MKIENKISKFGIEEDKYKVVNQHIRLLIFSL